MKSLAQKAGKAAEESAKKFLKKQGLKFITSNYRTRYGEIDLIMQQQDTLVFIEVRLRNNPHYGTGADSVTLPKQERIIHAARQYLQQEVAQPSPWKSYRFDVVSMMSGVSGASAKEISIDWIPDAFTLD